MTGRGMVERVERLGHGALRRLDRATVPTSLKRAWRPIPSGADPVWVGRLGRDRAEIVPWLSTMRTLDGSRILEIGSGRGASTFAMTEQGASVTAVDVNEGAIVYAKTQLGSAGLEAEMLLLNAAELVNSATDSSSTS